MEILFANNEYEGTGIEMKNVGLTLRLMSKRKKSTFLFISREFTTTNTLL